MIAFFLVHDFTQEDFDATSEKKDDLVFMPFSEAKLLAENSLRWIAIAEAMDSGSLVLMHEYPNDFTNAAALADHIRAAKEGDQG
jgi:hypothetical protein